jgi:hypothetical protein
MGLVVVGIFAEYAGSCCCAINAVEVPRKNKKKKSQLDDRVMVMDNYSSVHEGEDQSVEVRSTDQYPGDVSLLTSSIISESMLKSDTVPKKSKNNPNEKKTKGLYDITMADDDDDDSLPNSTFDENKIFDDNETWAAVVGPFGNRYVVNKKDSTPNTSPDTSRDEEDDSDSGCTSKVSKRCCCITKRQVGYCWSRFMILLSIVSVVAAWYVCNTGIMIQTDLSDLEEYSEILLSIFWGVTIGISLVVIVCLCVAVRTTRSDMISK